MTDDDKLLSISGIQHFVYCRRQWALIHIEQQWEENVLTVSGELAGERVGVGRVEHRETGESPRFSGNGGHIKSSRFDRSMRCGRIS